MIYQILAMLILATFYSFYFAKIIIQIFNCQKRYTHFTFPLCYLFLFSILRKRNTETRLLK